VTFHPESWTRHVRCVFRFVKLVMATMKKIARTAEMVSENKYLGNANISRVSVSFQPSFSLFLLTLGTPLGQSQYVIWMEREFNALKRLAACTPLTAAVSEFFIARYLVKSCDFFTPLSLAPRWGELVGIPEHPLVSKN